jgi:fatty-acyl-CoA synthase
LREGGIMDQDAKLSFAAGDLGVALAEHAIGDGLRLAAERFGPRIALVDGAAPDRRWSFSGLLHAAERTARALLTRFAPGEHVAICAANSPEWVMLELGAALAGLVLVTANPASTAHELAYVLRRSRAVGLFLQPAYRGRDLRAMADGLRPELPALREIVTLDDWAGFAAQAAESAALPDLRGAHPAQIQFTSGTTGAPKGAMLTHRGLLNNAGFYARTIGAIAGDVWVNPMPMFHTAGCGLATLGALQTGGVHVISPDADAGRLVALIERERGSIMLAVPTMLLRVLDHPDTATRDISSWRLCTMGGAPVAPELVRRAARMLGVAVAIGFGQTEASPYVTHTVPGDPDPAALETVGRPLPHTEIRIASPAGEMLPLGEIGEIQVRSYGVMLGYFDDDEATRAAFTADGWLRTGDLGSLDAAAYCRVQGRLREMIIRGGENIYPREIEDVLFTHPGVANVAVLGLPDAEWGEVVAAFVQPRDGAALTPDALDAFCRERLAAHKVPRTWRFVAELPQTGSGKIRKFALRDACGAAD